MFIFTITSLSLLIGIRFVKWYFKEPCPYLGGLNTRKEHTTVAIEALAYPTPTPSLPPAFAEAASRRQAEGEGNRHVLRVTPPPSRGRSGGGWGIGKDQFSKGGGSSVGKLQIGSVRHFKKF
ncbi:MAG: hypothetical protein A2V86_03370 [Deltaproteobacteria bacterium RBG_16_49_23]|nr:MAG: hypothetical protein A2V86_03370 [Deltaproteobacteria bacterium RBG_16_49_23]